MNAFIRYLSSLTQREAEDHIIECLRYGGEFSLAWELMSQAYGPDWRCPPEQLRVYVATMLNRLSGYTKESM